MAPPSTSPRPQLVIATRQRVDEEVFGELVAQEAQRLGADVRLRWVEAWEIGQGALADVLPDGGHLLLMPDPDAPDLVDLRPPAGVEVSRFDLALRDRDRSPGLTRHISGRGIDGIRWALRAAHHADRWPVHRRTFGAHPDQFGELRLPADPAGAPWPVVVLLHGGFWRSRWGLDLMDALAIDLAQRGLSSWNVEYRRPDRDGWAATVSDVTAAVRHLSALSGEFDIDPARTALSGHSAGGQLAVQVAADLLGSGAQQVPRLVVPLAGLVDLVETHRRDLGNGAVPMALGGTPEEIPEVYALASPLLRVPLRIDQVVVVGRGDSPDLREMSRRYVAAAGGRASLLEDEGDHFTVIDPESTIWERAAAAMAAALLTGS